MDTDELFAVVFLLVVPTIGLGYLTVRLIRRFKATIATVRTGNTAHGQCLRTELIDLKRMHTRHPHARPVRGSNVRMGVFGFATPTGTWVEFREEVQLVQEGEPVTVRYDATDPAGTATIAGPGGSRSPLIGLGLGIFLAAAMTLVLGFALVVVTLDVV